MLFALLRLVPVQEGSLINIDCSLNTFLDSLSKPTLTSGFVLIPQSGPPRQIPSRKDIFMNHNNGCASHLCRNRSKVLLYRKIVCTFHSRLITRSPSLCRTKSKAFLQGQEGLSFSIKLEELKTNAAPVLLLSDHIFTCLKNSKYHIFKFVSFISMN